MLDMTAFQQQYILEDRPNTHKPLCVILHLYYEDLWEWFLPFLENITFHDFDLYVSTTIKNESEINHLNNLQDRVKAHYPNANFYFFENKGLDVAPFLYILQNEILAQGKSYDAIIKLHGKKSLAHSIELGNRWRDNLTRSLLSSKQIFEHNFNIVVKSQNYKMAGSSPWILNEKINGYESTFFSGNPINFESYNFVGGTMFMIDFNLLKIWFEQNDIYNKFFHLFPEGYAGDGTLAHQLERVFGCMVKYYGYEIYHA